MRGRFSPLARASPSPGSAAKEVRLPTPVADARIEFAAEAGVPGHFRQVKDGGTQVMPSSLLSTQVELGSNAYLFPSPLPATQDYLVIAHGGAIDITQKFKVPDGR